MLLSLLGIIYAFITKEKSRVLLTLYTLIPLLMFSLLILKLNIAPRYLIFTLPGYALLSADIINRLFEYSMKYATKIRDFSPRINAILAYSFLIIILGSLHDWISLYNYYIDGIHPDWKSACHYVELNMKQGDNVASTADTPVEYYLGKIDFVLHPDFEGDFEKIKASKERVWLLIDEWRIEWEDPNYEIRNWILAYCIEVYEVRLIKIYLFTP